MAIEPALRKSPFLGVPPFINFVPGGGFPGKNIFILTYRDCCKKKWTGQKLG